MTAYDETGEQNVRWEKGVYLHVVCGCLFYNDDRGVICEHKLKGAEDEG